MRHVNYTLKLPTIDNAKPREKAYALTDGGGLQIEVLPSGSKTWRFRYHLNGKREKVTIGAYPAFTINRPATATRNCTRWSSVARAQRRPSGFYRPSKSSPTLGSDVYLRLHRPDAER